MLIHTDKLSHLATYNYSRQQLYS